MIGLGVAPALARADFQVGLQDDPDFLSPAGSPASVAGFDALGVVHGSTVRLTVSWPSIAPSGATVPAGFDAANPSDPDYDWSQIDAAVQAAAAQHARILLLVTGAPAWAQPAGEPKGLRKLGGPWDPSASDFAAFLHAAAVRYGGSFADPQHAGSVLPRVSDWEILNEENVAKNLLAPNPVSEYRSLLNAAYGALKAVHSDNVVVAGGLAPIATDHSLTPVAFAARLMCLRQSGHRFIRALSCPVRAHFDVFAIHPYSVGVSPTEPAYDHGDVLVANLGTVQQLVHSADALHTIEPRVSHPIWVTEWAWFTNPPDQLFGNSYATAARDVAYSMYKMWASGVSLVMWFGVQDPPDAEGSQSFYVIPGGGLYASSGAAKPTLSAFAFPVFASIAQFTGTVWGRAPVSGPARVTVQEQIKGAWRTLATVRTAADGVFEDHFPATANANFRAVVVGGPTSLPYNSAPIPPSRKI